MRLRRGVVAALLVGAATAALPEPAVGAEPVTTTIEGVRGVPFESGGAGMVGFEVRHELTGTVMPGSPLTGARVLRDDHPEAFDGTWGDAGFGAGWLAPEGATQFDPRQTTVEDVYFSNRLESEPRAVPLAGGDHAEIAMDAVSWDAPVLPDAPRGDPDGQLRWDAAVDVRTASASYGGVEGQMDVVVVRGDIVARGGDVDARDEPVTMPPLVVDLPRRYPGQVLFASVVGVSHPYTGYASPGMFAAQPTAGKAVMTASVQGWIHEAREHRVGDVVIREWHLPVMGVLVIGQAAGLEPVAAVSSATGGIAAVGTGPARRVTEMVPATPVLAEAQRDPLPKVDTPYPSASRPRGATGASEEASESAAGEFLRAAAVDRSLAAPVGLSLGDGRSRLVLDPNQGRQGVLAVRSVQRPSGASLVDAISVPFAVLGGRSIPLDRHRLRGLRAMPVGGWGPAWSTGYPFGTGHSPVYRELSEAPDSGFAVDAAYELGDGSFALIRYIGSPQPAPPETLIMFATIWTLDGRPADGWLTARVEVPAGGPVTVDGEEFGSEFTSPVTLESDVRFGGTHVAAGGAGFRAPARMTVVAGNGPLTPPDPDPTRSLHGGSVTVYMAPPEDAAAADRNATFVRAGVLVGEPAEPPASPPLGEPCGEPQTVDQDPPDALAAMDLVTGWMDADSSNLYATLQLREVPAAAPSGTVLRYSFHWRRGVLARYAMASLDDQGTWRFGFGAQIPGALFELGQTDGDVRTGEMGLVRIRIPRTDLDYRDGVLIRDTGAHTLLEGYGFFQPVDDAPNDADPMYGSGADYRVGTC